MRTLLLLAGAAAFAAAAPAGAKPGHAKGHGKGHAAHVANVKPAKVKAAKVHRSWATACPPGLVWRGANCIPPGHAKNLLGIGTRVPTGWTYTPWGRVPVALRDSYNLDPAYRYIYRDDVIYVVDPQTRLINSIISAVL